MRSTGAYAVADRGAEAVVVVIANLDAEIVDASVDLDPAVHPVVPGSAELFGTASAPSVSVTVEDGVYRLRASLAAHEVAAMRLGRVPS